MTAGENGQQYDLCPGGVLIYCERRSVANLTRQGCWGVPQAGSRDSYQNRCADFQFICFIIPKA